MPTYQRKTIVKSYKLRIKNKFKCLVEDTENVVAKLRLCVSVFNQRLEEVVNNYDDHFLSQYQKLNADFEKHQEKLFYLLASIDGTATDDDIEVAVSEESCSVDEDGSISPHNQLDQRSNLGDFSAALQSQTSLISSYRSLRDCSSANQTQFVINKQHNVVDCSPSDCVENYNSVSSVSNREHLMYVENSQPEHELDMKQSEKSISQSSCYRSLSSSSNQSSISTNLLESSVLENTEVKLLESNDPCSYPQLRQNALIPVNVSLNAVTSATLTHIVNPSDFWMQLKNSNGSKISFSISEFIEQSPPPYIHKGDFCLAPFKSLQYYYRAKALNEALGFEDVEVFFIDYGSTQKISLTNLRPLPISAYEIPVQAFHCKLYNVSPANGVWTSESTEKLKEFQNNSIETHVKSLVCDQYSVQLIATISALFSEDFSCDIAHALCLDGLATLDVIPQSDQECCNTEISNQTSCDSGVSVTSNQRASPFTQRLSYSSDTIGNSLPFDATETLNVLLNKNGQQPQITSHLMTDRHQDLISFESTEEVQGARSETLDAVQDGNAILLERCSKTAGCDCTLHLSIPPPSVSFVEKDMMLVMVSNIVSPSEFYVNLAMENSFTLDELQEQMSALYESQPDSYLIKADDLEEGMFCAGQYDLDCNWYRVVVLRIHTKCENSCDVYVQYVDYGNKALMKNGNLRSLIPKFVEHPSFAIKCSLTGVAPNHRASRSDNNDLNCWSEESIKKFRQLTSFDRCLTAQICESRLAVTTPIGSFHSTKRPIQVLLWDTEGTKDLLINEALVESGSAEIDTSFLSKMQLDYAISSKEKTVLNYWDPMNEEFNNIENSYGVHVEDCQVAISGYKQNDENYACRYFSFRGHCPRGDHCPYEHIDLAAGGVTRDQEETYSIDPLPPLPSPSSYVLVQVSSVVNPGLFYSVLPFGSRSVDEIDSLVQSGKSPASLMNCGEEFKALVNAMSKHYSNSPFVENTAVALAFGSIVAAWRKVDSAWHRARIIDESDISGPSKVFFVDFGDEDWIPRKSIREILPEYLYTPFQAIECHLSDIEPLGYEKGRNWSIQSVSRFKELLAFQVLLAHVTYRYGKILHLTLRMTNKENHENISDILVKEGFAQYQTRKASALKESKCVPG